MTPLALELDHTGVAVRDLDAGQAAYARLGFTLTPRGFHSGAVTPGGPVVPWGSGNHCAMFEDGYLEIIGIVDPDLHNTTKTLLDRYEGAHIVAFGSGEADAAFAALSARFEGVCAPMRLERPAAFGPDDEETRLAAFRNINLEPGLCPEAKFIFIEHLTRDVLWQPHLMAHANSAIGLAEIGLCVADVEATSERLGRLLGLTPKDAMPGVAQLTLQRGKVYVMNETGMQSWIPGITPPCLPYVATIGFSVRDLDAARKHLADNGVAYAEHSYPAIWIGPQYTHGPVISFIQA
jgi:catechol 2,3-dioxygenase-like lactoylglutathione lyase family enzyme